MVDEAIITLTKGEVHAKRGEWSKSYACYAKSLELYNTKLTDVDIAQPMISECKAQMSRLSKHINESKTQPPERAHSRSAHSRSATPITPIASETKSAPHASSRSPRQSPQNARKRRKPRKRVLNVNDLPKSLRKGKFYNKSTNNKNE